MSTDRNRSWWSDLCDFPWEQVVVPAGLLAVVFIEWGHWL